MAALLFLLVAPVILPAQEDQPVAEVGIKDVGFFPKEGEAIEAALDWLGRHQAREGGWDVVDFSGWCPEKDRCTGNGEKQNNIGVTGLALWAFVRSGVVPDLKGSEHAQAAARAVDYLMKRQNPDGSFGPTNTAEFMYGQATATMALSLAFGAAKNDDLKKSVEAAVGFLVKAQNPGAGWRYQPRCGESDTSVTAWCVLALNEARAAGFEVPAQAFASALAWVKSVTVPERGYIVGYTSKDSAGLQVVDAGKNEQFTDHPTMSALAILIRAAAGEQPATVEMKAAAEHLAGDLPAWDEAARQNTPMDFVYWYIGARAVRIVGESNKVLRTAWVKLVREAILQHQNMGGCRDGSWSPVCRWSHRGGRVFATAINASTLCESREIVPAHVSDQPAPAQKSGLQELLSEKRISLDFQDAPLVDALDFVRQMLDVNILLGQEVQGNDIRVTMKVTDLCADNALKLLTEMSGLAFEVADGLIFISTPEGVDEFKKTELLRQLTALKVSVDFHQAPFADVILFLSETSGVPVIFASNLPEAVKQKSVTVRAQNIPVKDFLDLLMETTGCLYDLRNGTSILIWMNMCEPKGYEPFRRAYSLKGVSESPEAIMELLKTVLKREATSYHKATNCIIVEGDADDHRAVIETLRELKGEK